MIRVLFLPFLQISSGHHHVADGMIESLSGKNGIFDCEKIDILSYRFGKIEALVSSIYLKWIHLFPGLYSWIYRKSVYENEMDHNRYRMYENLFLLSMEKLIEEKKPHLIICTHALPSYLLSQLKRRKKHTIPVINVYTDYFINHIWGTGEIEYHFVPNIETMDYLKDRGIESERIFVTGIPIHPKLKEQKNETKEQNQYSVLISGGNLGAGAIQSFIQKLQPAGNIHYRVLCGKNKNLFQFITEMNDPMIIPLSYISSKEEMNQLYHEADAIITKPGGVTISECLFKKIPIFVYHALPGQEEINLYYLKKQGLVFELEDWNSQSNLEEQIQSILVCEQHQNSLNEQLNAYHQHLSKQDLSVMIEKILTKHRI
jgi:processive 1,2-diacylglycerol beta-glucosyltransferase